MRLHFLQLDVFTRRPFGGNPLAVFTDARGLTTEQMQQITREMNYSESTFLLPPTLPGCDVKVRIFTPGMEMPMAGHPTVGTTAAIFQRGLVDLPANGALTLELGIGPVKVEVEPRDGGAPFVWMNHYPPVFTPSPVLHAAAADALGLAVDDLDTLLPLEVVSTGVPYLFVPVKTLEGIGRARSETAALARLFSGSEPASVGLFTREVVDQTAAFHARMFSPHLDGIIEDPATGSMAAPFGAYAAKYGLLPDAPSHRFVVEQGIEMGRPSQITVEVAPEGDTYQIRIGGDSVLVGEGHIFWD